MFAVFLFLTYFLQQNLAMSPVESGVAFLPMIGFVIITATMATAILVPRIGPKPLVAAGMLLSTGAIVGLAQLSVTATYAGTVLPAIIVAGMGMGLIMAPSMAAATQGVDGGHAGVASATVNTSQQIGGSIGTALLSSLAASAVSDSVKSALVASPSWRASRPRPSSLLPRWRATPPRSGGPPRSSRSARSSRCS